MHFSSHSYRHAELILNANYRIRKEIEDILNGLEVEHGERKGRKSREQPHDIIQKAFVEKGWSKETLISEDVAHKQFFDLYKEKVAVEIEFSRNEFLYRDYFRFLLAYNSGLIDVGVIITLDKKAKEQYKYDTVRPDLDYAVDDFQWLKPVLAVPISVLGVY